MKKRPPIVTVLGHVDHGKTTLLDSIRKSKIADREAGGITQGIGASLVETSEGPITFIDTPGHKAFSQMRERGAKTADLALLVVAADDGPMPQTKEALKYILASKTPFIVVFTKTDLPSSNFEKSLGQMEQEQVLFEGRGGDVPYLKVSAKKNEGLNELIELIHLVAEVNEVSGDSEAALDAVVIESNKDKRGVVVSVVVRNGTLKSGDKIYFGEEETKIRGLFNERNKPVNQALPGEPVLILGFSKLPFVGAKITSKPYKLDEKKAENNETHKDPAKLRHGAGKIPLVIKVKNAGSLDAISVSLPPEVYIARSGVGDVTDSDIFFAKTSGSLIFAFETKTSKSTLKLAESDKIKIYEFSIIYELLEKINEIIKSGMDEILGKLEILAIFPYNSQNVAGGKVLEGLISISDSVKVMRGEKLIGEAKIVSLRREKNELTQAKPGEECGVLLKPEPEFEIGDIIISYKK